jgi:hypothetical protein
MYVIYALKASTAIPVPIFTKLTQAQQNYAFMFKSEFPQIG